MPRDSCTSSRARRRRAAALIEAIVAAALLAVISTVLLRSLSLAAVERRAVEQRAIAQVELAGAAERAAALSWDELTMERLARFQLPPDCLRLLPDGRLTWTVEHSMDAPEAKHVRAEITWRTLNGGPSPPCSLNFWVYRALPASAGGVP
jgi:type II secretory pathway pseudopilin PulG